VCTVERLDEIMEDSNNEQDPRSLLLLAGIENIRRVIYDGQEYWSVVDTIGWLTDAANASKAWATIRSRMTSEGAQETLSYIIQLPMQSKDGRHRNTDAMTRQTLLRLVQSVSSPKAEPFKLFLAEAGEDYLSQAEQQVDSVEEMRQRYRKLGRDENWINARILYIVTRNAWTSEIQGRGIDDNLTIAKLTSILNQRTFGVTTVQHKQVKSLQPHHNLAEHKTRMELILSALGEETATGLHQKNDSQGYSAIERDVKEAGDTAALARRAVEQRLGEPVVSSQNFLPASRSRKTRISSKQTTQSLPSSENSPPSQPGLFDTLEE
jgi:DNA-damage-inducible protein D